MIILKKIRYEYYLKRLKPKTMDVIWNFLPVRIAFVRVLLYDDGDGLNRFFVMVETVKIKKMKKISSYQ